MSNLFSFQEHQTSAEFVLDYYKQMGPNLRERIQQTGFSLKEFGEEAGISTSYLYKVLCGQRSLSIPMMKAILRTWKRYNKR